MPQSFYIVLKTCQHAVEWSRNTSKILNLPVIACAQRPQGDTTAPTRRSHGVFIVSMTQRCWRLHIVHIGDLKRFEHCGNAALV